MIFFISAFSAFFAALVSSMFGGGYGLICIPGFYWIIIHFFPHTADPMQIAIATCGLSSAPMGLMSTIRQIKFKNFDKTLYKTMIITMAIGGLLGSLLAILIHSNHLKIIFSIVIILVALWMTQYDPKSSKNFHLPKSIFRLYGGCVAIISQMLGVSILNVPFFVKCGIPIKKAIGTSSGLIFTYSTIAITWMVCLGIPKFGISWHQFGYANLDIFVAAFIPGVLGALLGTKLVHLLPEKILKHAFIVVMFAAAISMMF